MWFRGTQCHHCISEQVLVPIQFCKWWRYLWPPGLASSTVQLICDAKGVFVPNCCCFWGADRTSDTSYSEIQSERFAAFLWKMPQRIWCDPCICNVNIESMLIRVQDPSVRSGLSQKQWTCIHALKTHCNQSCDCLLIRNPFFGSKPLRLIVFESSVRVLAAEVNCIWKFSASTCSAPEKSQLLPYISRRPYICVVIWHSRNSLEAVQREICMHR